MLLQPPSPLIGKSASYSVREESGEPPRFLRRKAAGFYLTEKYGFGAARTLAKLAVVGGGPAFRKIGRLVVYSPHDLDEWAVSRMSEPRRSTSCSAGEK